MLDYILDSIDIKTTFIIAPKTVVIETWPKVKMLNDVNYRIAGHHSDKKVPDFQMKKYII